MPAPAGSRGGRGWEEGPERAGPDRAGGPEGRGQPAEMRAMPTSAAATPAI